MLSLRGNIHVWLGCSIKMRSPKISTVLRLLPPDVHISGTDPSLVITCMLPEGSLVLFQWDLVDSLALDGVHDPDH